jgi:hypothetical protein
LSGVQPSVLRGFIRLARFRRDGFAYLPGTRQSLLNSMAPLIAFPLVGGGLMLAGGGGLSAVADLFATLVALLAPLVIAHFLAMRWGREAQWVRYAAAFNWCQWALPIAAVLLLLALGIVMRITGISQNAAALAFLGGLLVYGLGLHYFLARNGLELSIGRAIVCVVAMNLGTGLLVLAPRLLAANS